MMEKLQRFGGAMFTPVLLFAFNGIILALAIAMQNDLIMGGLAADGSLWSEVWSIIETAWMDHFQQYGIIICDRIAVGIS